MINTFHTSYNPPPVPPRAGYSRPLPQMPGTTPLLRFLCVMLLLLMVLTFGGFFYLSQKFSQALAVREQAAAAAAPIKGLAPSSNGPAAHMVLQKEQAGSNKQLVWNEIHSMMLDVDISRARDTLIIKSPGIYFIYSQISFSKHSSSSLKQAVWRKGPNIAKPEEILKSFCSLDSNKPDICTASLSGMINLQEKQELFVTVTNTSLLNKDSCSFGLFKL
ncbi:CD40 ligand isoform X2 [Triplophysa dalaica]|uniref:CD40 ligand isoform X2 n=1 Tax=Triplophysa dalaica TaxID=1582913 RepID=UPI0024DF74D7|nr:CD40 ligand isoform X2 [Triplophysa dalaica]